MNYGTFICMALIAGPLCGMDNGLDNLVEEFGMSAKIAQPTTPEKVSKRKHDNKNRQGIGIHKPHATRDQKEQKKPNTLQQAVKRQLFPQE